MKIRFTQKQAVKKLLFIFSIASLVFIALLCSTSRTAARDRAPIAFIKPEGVAQQTSDRNLRILDVCINPLKPDGEPRFTTC